MQSFRQYRQLGERVRAQYENNKDRRADGNAQSSRQDQEARHLDSSNTSLTSPISSDQEKADSPPSQRPDLDEGVDVENASDVEKFDDLNRVPTTKSQKSSGNQLVSTLTGIEVRRRTTREGPGGDKVFIVGFQGDDDPLNPHNWSNLRRWSAV